MMKAEQIKANFREFVGAKTTKAIGTGALDIAKKAIKR